MEVKKTNDGYAAESVIILGDCRSQGEAAQRILRVSLRKSSRDRGAVELYCSVHARSAIWERHSFGMPERGGDFRLVLQFAKPNPRSPVTAKLLQSMWDEHAAPRLVEIESQARALYDGRESEQ